VQKIHFTVYTRSGPGVVRRLTDTRSPGAKIFHAMWWLRAGIAGRTRIRTLPCVFCMQAWCARVHATKENNIWKGRGTETDKFLFLVLVAGGAHVGLGIGAAHVGLGHHVVSLQATKLCATRNRAAPASRK
jgi:hypothetical protein